MIEFLKKTSVRRGIALLIVAGLSAAGYAGVTPEQIEVVMSIIAAVAQ